ncbi:valyl-tRNA synthetase [Defluviimonas denitrificans]|jgi:valyl-tRNA synthetase|uniref:Valine--tRNA ligase n=1 Tax=Albidovulum denitrificans TaxID=404881 RepID=A0A2S8S9M1_9RHOB|nr:valine--tRNA ligase [Defluviimonas denitrificans]PQV57527.1 valyl-tRNA synthetase [Defluviimonas denitrificans]
MEKTFNAAEAEQRLYDAWENSGAFKAGANAKPGAETFCIMIPPPNVTGSLHMGHAFNNTLQDILVRWHRMRGFDTLWQPGQDHAGIATQMVVERELAKDKSNQTRREMGREKFLEKVWDWKGKSGDTIINQLKRLGASCDWSRNAFTMSGAPGAPASDQGNFHDAVIKVFVDLYNKGFIYRGKRLVNWDPHFETAISDLEVEQVEVAGQMWHFKYPLAGGQTYEYVEKDEDGTVTFRETRDYISIATTRPETMLGDGAVAVHPSDERYAPIVGKLCEIPVGPKEHRRLIPIITDEYPDPTFGSGAVKITGAHDFNDYGVAKRNDIPCYRLMDTKAAMRSDGAPYEEAAATAQQVARSWLIRKGYLTAGFAEQPLTLSEAEVDALNLVPEDLRGLDRYEARKRVIDQITAEGLAVTVLEKSIDAETGAEHLERIPLVEKNQMMQPHGDRSKVVIEPMLTDQWFVDTAKIVEPALQAVRDGMAAQEAGAFDEKAGYTRILPERDAKTYFHWLENIEPWCISRQLWWGHQIPVWYGPAFGETGEVTSGLIPFCAATGHDALEKAKAYYRDLPGSIEVSLAEEEEGLVDAVLKLNRGLVFNDADGNYAAIELVRDPDVLDTWFSSGLWPIGTLGWPEETEELKKYFPTDVLVTGFDIIFFWVARMMMMQLAVVDQVPFHTVYVHALVRDEKGKKMSKSLGNVLDPLDLIAEYGADAVRFTLTAMAAMGRDLKLSKDRIAGYRNFTTKLWNATRFAEMNACLHRDVVTTEPLQKPDATHTVNRWIIGETARARLAVDEALTAYRFNDAANTLYAFVWGKVCDWYVEFAKPLMDGDHAEETKATMAWVLDQCYTLLHPIMPFITEELWALTGSRDKLLVHADWPTYGADLIDENADREMNWVIGLIDEIRSARAQMHVPAGLKLPIVMTAMDERGRAAFARNQPMIERLARLDGMREGSAPKGAITIAVEGGSFAIPLEGVIDIAEEKARLSKTLEKLEKDLNGLKGRLSNPKFVESAPEEIVEETREKLELGQDEAAKLKAALQRLSEIG